MLPMEKLLVIATLGRKAYGRWLFQKLLVRGLVLLGLVLILAILMSALLVGWLLAAHAALLMYGVTPLTAMLVISLVTCLIILMLVLLVRHYLRQLPRILAKQSPLTERLGDTFNAFMDGFMET
jgi:hypothetical protein